MINCTPIHLHLRADVPLLETIACRLSMYLVYSMAFTATFAAMLPYFIYKAIRHGKYAASLKERLGFVPRTLERTAPVIWVHAVSVGEILAAEPLIQALIRELPGFKLVVSTTTLTGQTLAKDRIAKLSRARDPAEPGYSRTPAPPVSESCCRDVFYFPFDWRFAVKRALDRIHPAAVVIMETEIWPNFLDECRRRGIATIIANGRLSERSFSRYRLVRRFMRQVLRSITLFLMQTQADLERVISLGADPVRASVCGNLKYDAARLPAPASAEPGLAVEHRSSLVSQTAAVHEDLIQVLGLDGSRKLVVAGSTADGEEEILLAAFLRVIRTPGLGDTRLILAPRRPERFDQVARTIAGSSAALDGGWVRRSRVGTQDSAGGLANDVTTARIILLDSIGELAGIYRFASVVFVGGSLVPAGGHNIIEPALFAKPIIVGPYTDNFRQVVKDFGEAGALARIDATARRAQVESLATTIIRLLTDKGAAESLGAGARRILEMNKGATSRTVSAIRSTISQDIR